LLECLGRWPSVLSDHWQCQGRLCFFHPGFPRAGGCGVQWPGPGDGGR